MNELALFAGAGGGILGGKLLGWNTIGAVEIEEYPRKILLQRQKDGILGKFPIWDDITTFDGRPWKGAVDIVCGGFPCQDISSAGKGEGLEGERSGLWGQMARVVCEVCPRFVFVENSPMLTSRGIYRILGDLAEMGYNARWCVLGADRTGRLHKRERIWILGYSNKIRLEGLPSQYNKLRAAGPAIQKHSWRFQTGDDLPKPYYIRSSDGVAHRVDRHKAIGNGQVSEVAAIAFTILSEGLI